MVLDAVAKFRLSAGERTNVEAAARRNGLSFSAFVRRALTQAVRGITPDTTRSDLVSLRRQANLLDELAAGLQPREASSIQAAAAELRRVVRRHL